MNNVKHARLGSLKYYKECTTRGVDIKIRKQRITPAARTNPLQQTHFAIVAVLPTTAEFNRGCCDVLPPFFSFFCFLVLRSIYTSRSELKYGVVATKAIKLVDG
jgi:hypothetical protein